MAPAYVAPLREFRFIHDEVLAIDRYARLPGFDLLTPELRQEILTSVERLCVERLLPLNGVGDVQGCGLEDGSVRTPSGFRDAYRQFIAGGWTTLSFDPEFGGQGLPYLISAAVAEILTSTNLGFSGYVDITHAACLAIHAHGSAEQKRLYLPPMVAGRWTGAMNLTEPQAGSDLSLIRTRAEPQADGTYRICGGKCFITGVDHDLAENIVNLILARIPGSPAGTKGLSLFIAPKFLARGDGSLAERNAIQVISVEHKMGVRASATCAVNYEGATGYLVGEPNRGLAQMFTMINRTRLGVGLQGLGISEIACQNAVKYAHERRQGRAPGRGAGEADADPIVLHPDVRRMLGQMTAFNQGARILAAWLALQIDLSRVDPDPVGRDEARDFVSFLTPVVKAYFTDLGFENANLAMQCFGGYGYMRETGVEQFARDIRIGQIYEGTNGLQGLDLAARKLPIDGGRLAYRFLAFIETEIADSRTTLQGRALSETLSRVAAGLRQATEWLIGGADASDVAAAAVDYLRLVALAAMGWAWLRAARIAEAADPQDSFYANKIATAVFFLERAAPEAGMLLQRILLGARPLQINYAL